MTRAQLLLTTALVLAGAGGAARAQVPPAPGALPSGLRVIAGQASASQSGASLRVTQGTQRAALDWTSFNIGAQASVRFQAPGATSTTLNRVSGPGASMIAGRLSANDQLVLINQSGVVFMPGAVVDAQSIVVSAAGISEQNMRAGVANGRFVLDQPAHPGAQVVNNGRISVRRAGLAALVAPQVANHGTIVANFGTVSLNGVASHVVDLYGDGLLSIDVSRQTVTGADGQAALVTNDGLIAARGGRVLLSTAAVDGVVTNLVSAGGTISVDGAGRHGGTVLIDAQGGTAMVTGLVSARGLGAWSTGGQVAVQASQAVSLAAGSRIDASGVAGGGTVAIGTTLARARGGVGTPARASGTVLVAPGATVAADALWSGRGGRITVLSNDDTVTAGLLSARGGAAGGDGGQVEVSGTLGLSLLGRVDVTAAHGAAGGLTIDPTDLVVQSGGVAPDANTAVIDPNVLEGQSGDITLVSTDNLAVRSALSLDSSGLLTLRALHGGITIGGAITNNGGGIDMSAAGDVVISTSVTSKAAINITAAGAITQDAGAFLDSTKNSVSLTAGTSITLGAAITGFTGITLTASGGGITQPSGAPLTATTGGIALGATGAISLADTLSATSASGFVNFFEAGSVSQSGGAISTGVVSAVNGTKPAAIAGDVVLAQSGNAIGSVGVIDAPGGGITVDTAGTLSVVGALTAGGSIVLASGADMTIAAPIDATAGLALGAGTLGTGGLIEEAAGGLTSDTGGIALGAPGAISLAGAVSASSANGFVNFFQAASISQTGGAIATPVISAVTEGPVQIGGDVVLDQPGNAIAAVGGFQVGGTFSVTDAASVPTLTVEGTVTASDVALTATRIEVVADVGFITAGTVELAPESGEAVSLGFDSGSGFAVGGAPPSGISVTTLLRIGATAAGGVTAGTVTVSGAFGSSGVGTLPTLELDSNGGITVNAPLIANTLLLGGRGTVTQGVGGTSLVSASLLAGSPVAALGGLDLPSTSNTIPQLGPITTGPLTLGTRGTLQVVGAVAAGTSAVTLDAAGGGIDIAANITAGALSLTTGAPALLAGAVSPNTVASGDVVQETGAVITASALSGNVAGSATLTDASIGAVTIGPLAAAGTLSITAGGAATVTGPVSGSAVTLDAAGVLAINSTVSSVTINLRGASITEDVTAGALDGGQINGVTFPATLSGGTTGGDATLLGANHLGTVQTFAVQGTLSLFNAQSLAIQGGVAAQSATLHVAPGTPTAPFTLSIFQPLTIPGAGTLSLQTDDLLVGQGASNDVIAGGSIALIAVAPDTLGLPVLLGGSGVTTGGTLNLGSNGGGNSLPGTLQAATLEIGGLPDGTITAGSIIIAGALPTATTTLRLDTTTGGGATGLVSQTAALTVGTIDGDVGGSLQLATLRNGIRALGNLTVGGNATIETTAALSVAGAVDLPTAASTLEVAADQFGFGALGSIAAGTASIGPLDAGHSLSIGSTGAGDINLGNLGAFTVGTLDAGGSGVLGTPIASAIALSGDANLTGTLSLLTSGLASQAAGSVTVTTLVVDGAALVESGGTITADATDLGFLGSLTQSAGLLKLGVVTLTDEQSVQQTGGTFEATSLAGNVLSALSLPQTVNQIGTLDALTVGSIALASGTALEVAGEVFAGTGTLQLVAPSVSVDAGAFLQAAAGIDLTLDALTGSPATAVFNPGATVQITPFSAAALTIGPLAGQVDIGAITAATLTLNGDAAGIDFAGSENLTGAVPSLVLNAAGDPVTQTGGILTVASLSGIAGSLSLPDANAIGALAGFTADTGDLRVTDGGALTVSGTVLAGGAGAQTIDLQAASLTLAALTQINATSGSAQDAVVLTTDALSGAVTASVPGGTVLLQRITAGPQAFGQSGGIIAGTLELGALPVGGAFTSTSLQLGTLSGLSVGTLLLETSGGVTQTGVLALSGTLSGAAGSVLLGNGANTVGVLANFSAGTSFLLSESGALALTGPVAVGTTITLNAASVSQSAGTLTAFELDGTTSGDMQLADAGNSIDTLGALSIGGTFNLTDIATLTEGAAGSLSAGTLAGSFGSDVTLTSQTNAITNLGSITASGSLSLVDGATTLAGPISATEISLNVDGLNYGSGSLTATGTPPPPPGAARPFFASGGTVEIAPRTAEVLNLGTFSTGAAFVSPTVLANVNALVLRLGEARGVTTATGLFVNAPVSISAQVGTIDFETQLNGPVGEQATGASLAMLGTLTGNTGAVALNVPGVNSIPTVGPYVAGGDFALDDNGNLAIEGFGISASNITLALGGALTLDQGGLSVPTATGQTTGTIDLTAASASEVNGIVSAATLESSGTPGFFNLDLGNDVATLGNWNGSGGLVLIDDTTSEGAPPLLTVNGPVSATAVQLRALAITLAGTFSTGLHNGSVDLSTAGGALTQTGGTVTTALLTSAQGVVGGDAVLNVAGNLIDNLGTFSVPNGALVLTDSGALDVIGGGVSANAATLTDPVSLTFDASVTAPQITLRGGALTFNAGSLLAGGGIIDLAGSSATQTGTGILQAGTLLSGATPSGAFVLGNGNNAVATLGGFQMAAGGTLLLADAQALSVAGPVSADAVTLSGPTITIAGAISGGVVDLSTTKGGVVETTGSVTAGLLQSSRGIVGGATLENAGGGNAIAALGNMAVSGGDLTLFQAGGLGVNGGVSTPDTTLRIGGALQVAAGGTLQASGFVDLTANGATEAATGGIVAGVLESTQGATGAIDLEGANQIATLGTFAMTSGLLALRDGEALKVTGPVTVPSLSLYAPGLTLSGNVTAQTADLSTPSGGVVQTGGSLAVGLLTSQRGIAGAVSLPDANRIAALGDFSAQGQVALNDATGLDVSGAVSAPAGLNLTVAGALTESGTGQVATSLLTGQAASVQWLGGGNAIGTIAFATPGGGFALADQPSLTIQALSGSGAALDVNGDLTLAGPVAEGGATVSLAVSGAVTQTGGTLAAALLQGSAGSVSLPDANQVAALGGFTAPGGFALADAGDLAITGAVQAGVIDLSIAAGGITEPGGTLVTGRLQSRLGITGDALLAGPNQVAALGPLTDGGRFQLADTVALVVDNVTAPTLDLSTTAGGISQDGPIDTTTLLSSFGITGGARFDAAGNRVAVLGRMQVAGGDLTLVTGGDLRIAGPVGAPNASVTSGGSITQTGDVVVPGTFSTTSILTYTRTGGALAVGTLTGSAGSVADFGSGAAVQRIGAFDVQDIGDRAGLAAYSQFALLDATALTLSGPLSSDYIRLLATGTLVWDGNITTFGLPRLQQVTPNPNNPGTWLEVVPGAGGTAQILQNGQVQIFTQDGGLSTVRLQLPPAGGNISLSNLQGPNTDLILFIGAGHASGTVNLGDLFVSGQQGGTSLFGTVRGLAGVGAARESVLAPVLNANYRINGCPLSSVNCILLPTEQVPAQNPLSNLAIGQARDELDDADVLLPDVAEQDY